MRWIENTVKNVHIEEINYPRGLLSLKKPPKHIYYRGELAEGLLQKSVAVVGSRRMTRYGASCIERFVSAFAQEGTTTVSGYMYGVDTEVHTRTIEYGGSTIAVMGSGINQPYPPENDILYTKILQNNGIVLSEYTPESKPKLWMYPQRNRIIAALATMGVLVIEASLNSGSLITVKYARKLKKNIFAIPGPITSSVSEGTNYLIKKGIAKMVTGPEDIVRPARHATQGIAGGVRVTTDFSPLERVVYEVLRNEEMTIDEIAVAVGKSSVEVVTTVSLMALRGVLSEAGGKYFVV